MLTPHFTLSALCCDLLTFIICRWVADTLIDSCADAIEWKPAAFPLLLREFHLWMFCSQLARKTWNNFSLDFFCIIVWLYPKSLQMSDILMTLLTEKQTLLLLNNTFQFIAFPLQYCCNHTAMICCVCSLMRERKSREDSVFSRLEQQQIKKSSRFISLEMWMLLQ